MPKYKTKEPKHSPVHSIATELNKLDKTLQKLHSRHAIDIWNKKEKTQFYYLHRKDSVGEFQNLATYNVY